MSATLVVRIDNELSDALQKLCLITERSKSYHVKKALKRHIDNEIDAQKREELFGNKSSTESEIVNIPDRILASDKGHIIEQSDRFE